MKGDPSIVKRARAKWRGPVQEKNHGRAPIVRETHCKCGSKLNITCKIQMAGKEPVYACASCAEHAPFCAHVSRVDARVFPKGKGSFTRINRLPPKENEEKKELV
jgi:hypothetical protein